MTMPAAEEAVDERPAPSDPAWTGMTHRLGRILRARQKIPSGLPPSHPAGEWTRAVAAGVLPAGETRDDRPVLGPEPLERLALFTGKSRAWFGAFVQPVVDLYATHIERALRESGEKNPEITLTDRSAMELISGDVRVPGLPSLTTAIAQRKSVYEGRASEAARQLDAIVACVPEIMSIPDTFRGATGAVARGESRGLGQGRYFLISHSTVRGSRGIFIARTQSDQQSDQLYLCGISGSDPEGEALVQVEYLRPLGRKGEPRRPLGSSPSQHVTAEIANKIAKYF